MIYLDYSATTPVSYDVLESYNKATRDYMGNANSIHALGVKSKVLLNSATKQLCELFDINENELVYTSGATESNNMALKGIALSYKNRGNHIIVSKLEHPSIYAVCNFLELQGYEISYVNNDSDGLIDFEDLKKKIRPTTILVSICAVNSEVGIRQPLKTIRQIIKKENPNTLFHSDMTQAIGKISVNMNDVDMASMSAHKIFGPKGIGFLYKSSKVNMTPLIHGSGKFNDLRSGTPPLPLVVALSKACRIALTDLERREANVKKLNDRLCEEFGKIDGITINSTKYSIPHILNISLRDVRPETFIHALEEDEIYVSTNTA
jgi:cysteine desulfurase